MKHLRLYLIPFLLVLFHCPTFGQSLHNLNEKTVVLKTEIGSINGKLLTPSTTKSSSLVLFISGSGPTDMNGNSPVGIKANYLKQLAEQLSEKGIASLRFDKRGIASSAAALVNESSIRFEDYVNDVKGWIDYLSDEYNFTNIIVAGHSEGSLIGMLACQNNTKVSGFISLAGIGRVASDVIEEQLSAQKQPESILKMVISMNDSLKSGKLIKHVPYGFEALFRPSVQPYLISWYKHNPQQIIKTLNVPILIVQGTTDIQVSVKDAELLKAAAPKSKLLLIDNMNHLLKYCESTNPQIQNATYTNPNLPIANELTTAIVSFIKK